MPYSRYLARAIVCSRHVVRCWVCAVVVGVCGGGGGAPDGVDEILFGLAGVALAEADGGIAERLARNRAHRVPQHACHECTKPAHELRLYSTLHDGTRTPHTPDRTHRPHRTHRTPRGLQGGRTQVKMEVARKVNGLPPHVLGRQPEARERAHVVCTECTTGGGMKGVRPLS